ncbi:metallophosphoesterase [Archangium violaceum]|uniref:metallophosphoesterase n=1 Tax=Archangium violaceum TaxID=83451 RepID=UPI001F2AE795|nr:metallophosphoesterase [Archangium violaceum]
MDLVCFTGDVADWGKPEEYGPATDFIQALLERLSLPVERLFLVPGNHDIDRTQGKSAWSKLRGKKGLLFQVNPLDLSRWMAGGRPPLGLEKVKREVALPAGCLSRVGLHEAGAEGARPVREVAPPLPGLPPDTPASRPAIRHAYRGPRLRVARGR